MNTVNGCSPSGNSSYYLPVSFSGRCPIVHAVTALLVENRRSHMSRSHMSQDWGCDHYSRAWHSLSARSQEAKVTATVQKMVKTPKMMRERLTGYQCLHLLLRGSLEGSTSVGTLPICSTVQKKGVKGNRKTYRSPIQTGTQGKPLLTY